MRLMLKEDSIINQGKGLGGVVGNNSGQWKRPTGRIPCDNDYN